MLLKLLTMSSLDLSDRNGIWINISPFWESIAPLSFPPAFLQITAPPGTQPASSDQAPLPFGALVLCLLGVLHLTASSEQGKALQV